MKSYEVEFAVTYYWLVNIEAESGDEAEKIADEIARGRTFDLNEADDTRAAEWEITYLSD